MTFVIKVKEDASKETIKKAEDIFLNLTNMKEKNGIFVSTHGYKKKNDIFEAYRIFEDGSKLIYTNDVWKNDAEDVYFIYVGYNVRPEFKEEMNYKCYFID